MLCFTDYCINLRKKTSNAGWFKSILYNLFCKRLVYTRKLHNIFNNTRSSSKFANLKLELFNVIDILKY